ncbi:hypothetical protein KIL84_006039, partial [Mauremys mutica]
TSEEVTATMTGLRVSDSEMDNLTVDWPQESFQDQALGCIDWRKSGYVTNVKNQVRTQRNWTKDTKLNGTDLHYTRAVLECNEEWWLQGDSSATLNQDCRILL